MGSVFNSESPLMTSLARVADIMILSLLWVVCSLPVITIGVSSSALYYVMLKIVRGEDVHVVRLFIKSLKDNLFQGMIMTLIRRQYREQRNGQVQWCLMVFTEIPEWFR